MKKRKVLLTSLLRLLLVCGLLLTGCGSNKCPEDGKCKHISADIDASTVWCGRKNCTVYANDNSRCNCR
jgi:hypothetical protein